MALTESPVLAEEAQSIDQDLLDALLTGDTFWPEQVDSLAETGLSDTLVESLICKHLAIVGTSTGRAIADHICLPFRVLDGLLDSLRTRQLLAHAGSAPFNDYRYTLTEAGRNQARTYFAECKYAGPAPVPLAEYITSVDAQSISAESPDQQRLMEACADISVEPQLFEALGPAINSGAGLFLYGAPGNGKSTLATRLTSCFGQHIWVPHTLIESGQLIKFYDAQFHRAVPDKDEGVLAARPYDRRWIKIRRPTVIVGGEMTLANLEISHNPDGNICEAPLHMKSNCGCLLIDDFGRQRIKPDELLNRWIVPLESKHDFLTLPSGKKIQVPFEQLIIFSTNLEPEDLVDEAFLRRIPYKVETEDPGEAEFHYLFRIYCEKFGCEYRKDVVNYLIETHYRPVGRAMRRCHPRDLLIQVRNYCRYKGLRLELLPDYLDRAVKTYFAMVLKHERPRAGEAE